MVNSKGTKRKNPSLGMNKPLWMPGTALLDTV